MVRIEAGFVQDDQGSAGDAAWDHAALVQAPPWKTVFGFLPGIAAKPSWKLFKAGCRSGDSQGWFFGLRGVWGLLWRFSQVLVAAVLVSSGVGREAEVGVQGLEAALAAMVAIPVCCV